MKGVNNAIKTTLSQSIKSCDRITLLSEWKYCNGALMYHYKYGTCVKFIIDRSKHNEKTTSDFLQRKSGHCEA